MRERESCQYDKLDSVRDENHALGILNSQLRLRVEAMEAKKREAIEQWEIERAHLKQELARAQASESRYRSQGQREEGEVSGSSNRMTSSTSGVNRGLFGGQTSEGEQTPFAGNKESQDTANAQSNSGKRGGLGSNIPMSPKGGATLRQASTGSSQGGNAESLTMTAIARSMITGKAAVLNGAQITKTQVKKWIESVRLQLETNTFDPAMLPTIIDPRAMMVIKIKIATSRTLRENLSSDWPNEWDMETFLKALEEVFSEQDSDRFETATSLWKNWSYDLRYTGKLIIGKLSEFIGILTANCCTAFLRPFQRCFWSYQLLCGRFRGVLELIAPNLKILLLFISNIKNKIILKN
jgi:hypothetical protein